jgi:hypothetical protein
MLSPSFLEMIKAGGWKQGELSIIAGCPASPGQLPKSTFALHHALQAIADGKQVIIIGNEIPAYELARRVQNVIKEAAMASNPPKVNVGDKVKLNDHGLEMIFGTPNGPERLLKNIEMTITEIEDPLPVGDGLRYPVRVDVAEISQMFIDDHCFDKVTT